MAEVGMRPPLGDVLLDVRGEAMPFVVGTVHEFVESRDAWRVTTYAEGIEGLVRWDTRFSAWTWVATL